jgi:uncharacterized membrane protein YccC
LRAGVAVAVTVLAGAFLHLPHFGLAALGALLTCFADPGGPVRRRAPAVISFAICSGLAYAAFGMIRAEGPLIAAPVAGFAIFCACYARIYGQAGLQVGNLLSVAIVLALDYPAHSLAQAAGQGLNIAAGAFWAALLTLVIWQIHPYQPARRALAEVAKALSLMAKDLARLTGAGDSAAYAAHAALHRRAVREAIETARGVALDTIRRRGVVSRRAAQLTIRLQTLEQIFGGLIALSDILEHDAAPRAEAASAIRLIAGWLAALGPDIEAGKSLETPKKRGSLERLRAAVAKLPETAPRRHVLESIAENLAVLVTVSTPAGQTVAGAVEPWRARSLSPIRQNFSFSSTPMRHALRAGIIATPVLVFTMSIPQQFAHWTTITMVLCLQPYFSATRERVVERIAGTALGGLLAAAIGLFSQTQMELALTMLPLTVFAFTIRAVSYGAFVAALTPMVVLLVEQIAPGSSELHVALARIGYTFLGGALAILGNLLLWPGFESTRVETSIGAAIAAHAAYANAVFSALLDGAGPPDAARRAAGLASNNLEASLARALAEPHKDADALIERGAIVDAALRRLAGRLTVLALDRPAIPPAARPVWEDWQNWLISGLLGRPAGKPQPRPQLPEGSGADALTRLARQVDLILG